MNFIDESKIMKVNIYQYETFNSYFISIIIINFSSLSISFIIMSIILDNHEVHESIDNDALSNFVFS